MIRPIKVLEKDKEHFPQEKWQRTQALVSALMKIHCKTSACRGPDSTSQRSVCIPGRVHPWILHEPWQKHADPKMLAHSEKTQCPDSKMKRKALDCLKKKGGLSFNLHFYKKLFLHHNMAPAPCEYCKFDHVDEADLCPARPVHDGSSFSGGHTLKRLFLVLLV